jgi:hypothetical protein
LGWSPSHLLDHGRPTRSAKPDGRTLGHAATQDGRAPHGNERNAILGYIEDGSKLVTKAMNGWADPEPAWWLNLLAHPDAMVDLSDGSRLIRGRAATEDERPRLWASWAVYNKKQDAYAALRSRQTQVVILEPRFD